jgi:hypothetical protein
LSLANVEKVLKREEQRFAQTLDQGMGILTEAITQLKGNEIDGETVFKLFFKNQILSTSFKHRSVLQRINFNSINACFSYSGIN